LDAEERAAIAAQARIRTFEAGETVFNLGSPGDGAMDFVIICRLQSQF
jgi:hypothetical protein